MSTRIYWIDWLKVFGMCLVVYAHIDTESAIHQFIFAFHMPLFFIISGFLYKHREFKKECQVVLKSLVIPYFILTALLVIYCSYYIIDDCIHITIGSLESVPPRIRPMWFVYSLACMRLVTSICGNLRRVAFVAFDCICIFLLLLFFNLIPEYYDYFQINTTIMAFPFFALGMFLKKYFNWIIRYKLYLILLSIPFFYLATINGEISLIRCDAGYHWVLFYLNATFISLFLLLIFKTFLNHYNGVIKTTAMGLIIILALHLSLIDLINDITLHLLHPAILTLLIMVIGYILSRLSLRYFPILFGKPFKRRDITT